MAKLREQEHPRRKQPLTFWNVTKDALSFALKDIWEDPELLKECYAPVREREYDEETFVDSIMTYINDFRQPMDVPGPTLPFVIYGDPGMGKTTFLHHTLELVVAEQIPLQVISLDYRKIAAETLEVLRSRVYEDIARHLWTLPELQLTSKQEKGRFFQDVFSERLKRTILSYVGSLVEDSDLQIKIGAKIEGFMNASDILCEDVIDYLGNATGQTFVIILDNFDHDIQNQGLHLNVLTVAREAIERLRCPVFVPMRNYTRFNAFDRFAGREVNQFRSLVLSKVDFHAVLEKRRQYTVGGLLKRKSEEIDYGCKRYQVSAEWVVENLNKVWNAFEVESIFNFLDVVSNGNLRTLWDIIMRVLQSTYFEPSGTSSDYAIFLKSALLDNNAYFEPDDERNRVINLYDNNGIFSPENCLIRIRILQMLNYFASPIIISKILSHFYKAGYERSSVLEAIRSLQKAGLIDVLPAPEAVTDENSIINLNTSGKLYLDELLYQVEYLENVLPSTNVSQPVVVELKQIKGHEGKRLNSDLAKRFMESYLVFVDFVNNMEDQERTNVQSTEMRSFEGKCPRIAKHLERSITSYYSRFLQKDYTDYRYGKPKSTWERND